MIFSKPIVLVGMMGCGKSTIGKIVAEKLKWIFIDTDKEIESIMKLSIKEIFERFGEEFFRKKEYEILRNKLGKEETSLKVAKLITKV